MVFKYATVPPTRPRRH